MLKTLFRQIVDFFVSGSDKSVFAICFLLSALFWFLIKFSKEYTYYISCPIEFVNHPIDKYLQDEPPTEVKVKVKAFGFNFLKNVFATPKLEIDVSKLPINKFKSYWLSSQDQSKLAENLKGFSILDIKPDTIHLNFSERTKKKVQVVVPKAISFKDNYIQYGSFKIVPEQIEVYGPSHILDTLTYVNSELLEISNLQVDIDQNLRLTMPHNLLSSRVDSVHVSQAVARYTQITKSISILVKNKPASEDYYLKPDKVELSYWVAMDDVSKVSESDFVIYCDYDELKMTDKPVLNVFLDEDKLPSIVKRVQYYPDLTTYLAKD